MTREASIAATLGISREGGPTMRDAISYKRFSTPKQMRGGSDQRQTELTEEYCKRHKLRLIDSYLDAGLSGFTGANLTDGSALRLLLHAARLGHFKPGTRLIIESLDRLTRREISTAIRLFLDILDTGFVIITLIDGEEIFTKDRVDNDLTALIIAIVFLARANNESKTKRQRALENQKAKRKKAREHQVTITSECPKWLTLVGKGDERRFVANSNRVSVIERVFKMAASGQGQWQIGRYLNQHKVSTFSGAPKWRPGMLAHLLASRALLGEFQPHLTAIENGKAAEDHRSGWPDRELFSGGDQPGAIREGATFTPVSDDSEGAEESSGVQQSHKPPRSLRLLRRRLAPLPKYGWLGIFAMRRCSPARMHEPTRLSVSEVRGGPICAR